MLVSCTVGDNHSGRITSNSEEILLVDNVVLNLFDQETFDTQRQLWLDQELQNYSFCLNNKSSPSLPPWSSTVVIKNGIVDSVSPNNPAYGDTWQEFAVPISGIFDFIVRSKELVVANASKIENKDPEFQYSYSLEIEYNSEYHFPQSFSSTFVFNPKDPTKKLEGNSSCSNMTITNFSIDQ
jgi:hypothetical protein